MSAEPRCTTCWNFERFCTCDGQIYTKVDGQWYGMRPDRVAKIGERQFEPASLSAAEQFAQRVAEHRFMARRNHLPCAGDPWECDASCPQCFPYSDW